MELLISVKFLIIFPYFNVTSVIISYPDMEEDFLDFLTGT
jgi:hypothetical protein